MDRIGKSKEVNRDYYTSFVSIDIVVIDVKTLTTGLISCSTLDGPITLPVLVADDGRYVWKFSSFNHTLNSSIGANLNP